MIRIFILITLLCTVALAQSEILTNRNVIELSRVGLAGDVIIKKIATARTDFVVTADALVELKQAGVADSVIAAMLDKNEKALPAEPEKEKIADLPASEVPKPAATNAKEAIATAKTISIGKSSIHPSTQAVEKELLKREDFRSLNLTIVHYGSKSDLFVDIDFVHGSMITHRYVYRIYERRSGAVVAAGETTSWGSLAENLARHISKRLTRARQG
ncbi:MAG TPA: hypothetical protein VNA22_03310 [Pyrinomonadaceae bacterium]|nr:hypothetical protein [Pyrinomonadaceae bacterium]